jgi:hypothetical protein
VLALGREKLDFDAWLKARNGRESDWSEGAAEQAAPPVLDA